MREPTSAGASAPLTIEGVLRDGLRVAAGFTELPWVREQTQRRLGFVPYSGTLNVRISSPDALEAWERLKKQPGIPLEPEPDFCAARCYSVLVEGRIGAAIVVPLVPGYPPDVMELLAPVQLRDALDLQDGAALTVVVPPEA